MSKRVLPSLAALVVATTGCDTRGERDGGPAPDGPWTTAVQAGADAGALLSVWGADPGDAWAVGGQVMSISDAGAGVAFRRSSSGWERAELPADTPLLNWVHGANGGLWTVGNAGAALRWDGTTWQREETGVNVPLWGVFVFSADDIWAVGGDALDRDTPGVVLHRTAAGWSYVDLPELDRASSAFFKVFGFAPNDIHVVGAAGVLLRYDGITWTQQASGTASDMISLWGSAPDDIVAVGGRSVGTVGRWNGSSWELSDLPTLPGLNGVWVDEQGRASIVGNMGTANVLFSGFDAVAEQTDTRGDVLHAVFGFEDGTRIAVGGTLNSSPPWTGVILENAP